MIKFYFSSEFDDAIADCLAGLWAHFFRNLIGGRVFGIRFSVVKASTMIWIIGGII